MNLLDSIRFYAYGVVGMKWGEHDPRLEDVPGKLRQLKADRDVLERVLSDSIADFKARSGSLDAPMRASVQLCYDEATRHLVDCRQCIQDQKIDEANSHFDIANKLIARGDHQLLGPSPTLVPTGLSKEQGKALYEGLGNLLDEGKIKVSDYGPKP